MIVRAVQQAQFFYLWAFLINKKGVLVMDMIKEPGVFPRPGAGFLPCRR